jgi:hypothetical protein
MTSTLVRVYGSGGTYKMPGNGRVWVQALGTGTALSMTMNDSNTTIQFNSTIVLASGALYEFLFHVENGDTYTFSGATWLRIWFAEGES